MTDNTARIPKLRIAIFANEGSIHTRRWVLGLRERGHRVDLITLRKSPGNDIGGIDLGANSKADYLTKIPRLRRAIKSLNPDIFHSHYLSSFGFLASFVDHPRKIVSVWGIDLTEFARKNLLYRAMVNRALDKAHKVSVTSRILEKAVVKFRPGILAPAVVPFGVDVSRFAFIERNQGKILRIGIAKHLYPIYGVDILIKAFGIVTKTHRNIELIIGGTGPYEEEYRKLAADLNLNGQVRFVGHIDHEKMPEFLASLDIAAMTSSSDDESFGVAALEASSTGLPVVATRVGGIPEVVIDGVTGYLAPGGNIVKIAECLNLLIERPDLRAKLGRAGRSFVEDSYNWHDCISKMEKIYSEMMAI